MATIIGFLIGTVGAMISFAIIGMLFIKIFDKKLTAKFDAQQKDGE